MHVTVRYLKEADINACPSPCPLLDKKNPQPDGQPEEAHSQYWQGSWTWDLKRPADKFSQEYKVKEAEFASEEYSLLQKWVNEELEIRQHESQAGETSNGPLLAQLMGKFRFNPPSPPNEQEVQEL